MDIEDLYAAATVVTVPGAPLSLSLHGLHESPGFEPRVSWSFDDPFPETGDVVSGVTAVREDAESTWLAAQLDAAWVYVRRLDMDWTPGVAPSRRRWGASEAWEALIGHLGGPQYAVVVGDEIRTEDRTLRHFDPESWAAYLNATEDAPVDLAQRRDADPIVPVGMVHTDGLPLWARDELDWGFGDAPVLTLVDGRLVSSRSRTD